MVHQRWAECTSSGHQSAKHQTKHNLIPSAECYFLGAFKDRTKRCHQCAGVELLLRNSEPLSQVSRALLPRVREHPAITAPACSSVCAPLLGQMHTHGCLRPGYYAVQWHSTPPSFCLTLILSLGCHDLSHVFYFPKSVFSWIYILHYKLCFLHLFCALCVCITMNFPFNLATNGRGFPL